MGRYWTIWAGVVALGQVLELVGSCWRWLGYWWASVGAGGQLVAGVGAGGQLVGRYWSCWTGFGAGGQVLELVGRRSLELVGNGKQELVLVGK